MISREDMKQYQQIQKEVETLDTLIEQTYNTYKSPALFSEHRTAGSVGCTDPVSRALAKIERLKKQREQYVSRMIELEDFVSGIPDLKERAICSYRYLLGYSWKEVSNAMCGHSSYGFLSDYDRNWWKAWEQSEQPQNGMTDNVN